MESEETPTPGTFALVAALLTLVVAGLWGVANVVGIDPDGTELAIAEASLLVLVAGTYALHARHARAQPWRDWLGHVSGWLVMWAFGFLILALLGGRPDTTALSSIWMGVAGVTLLAGARFAWRGARRRLRAS